MRYFLFMVYLFVLNSSSIFATVDDDSMSIEQFCSYPEEKFNCDFNGYSSYYCDTGGFEKFLVPLCKVGDKNCFTNEKIYLSDFMYVLEEVYEIPEEKIHLIYDSQFVAIYTKNYDFGCRYELTEDLEYVRNNEGEIVCDQFHIKIYRNEVSVKDFLRSEMYRDIVKNIPNNRPFKKFYSLKDRFKRKCKR